MIIIGLTGGSGSGKSKIASILKDYNMLIIDADEIAHKIIKKGETAYIELIETFGTIILDSESEIDRKKLGAVVFNNKKNLTLLTKCTHKHIIIEIKKIIDDNIENNNIKGIVIDAPLLIESGLNTIVDTILIVYADIETRVERIMVRDNITYEQAKNRINSQTSWEELSTYADIIINNNNKFSDTVNQIKEVFKTIL